ncbi:MAG: hypothetical protein RL065_822 [Bacteroidota bacterium]|jgi:hypothetical protein
MHNREWFQDRVGKKIRKSSFLGCECVMCSDIRSNGFLIKSHRHADFLYESQNDLSIEYYE